MFEEEDEAGRAADVLMGRVFGNAQDARRTLVEGHRSSVPLVSALLHAPLAETRMDAVGILKEIGPPDGTAALIACVSGPHPDPTVRIAAALALGDVGAAEAVAPLIAVLRGRDGQFSDEFWIPGLGRWSLRGAVEAALRRIGARSDLRPLIDCLSSEDDALVEYARDGLARHLAYGDEATARAAVAAVSGLGDQGHTRAIQQRLLDWERLDALLGVGPDVCEFLVEALEGGDGFLLLHWGDAIHRYPDRLTEGALRDRVVEFLIGELAVSYDEMDWTRLDLLLQLDGMEDERVQEYLADNMWELLAEEGTVNGLRVVEMGRGVVSPILRGAEEQLRTPDAYPTDYPTFLKRIPGAIPTYPEEFADGATRGRVIRAASGYLSDGQRAGGLWEFYAVKALCALGRLGDARVREHIAAYVDRDDPPPEGEARTMEWSAREALEHLAEAEGQPPGWFAQVLAETRAKEAERQRVLSTLQDELGRARMEKIEAHLAYKQDPSDENEERYHEAIKAEEALEDRLWNTPAPLPQKDSQV